MTFKLRLFLSLLCALCLTGPAWAKPIAAGDTVLVIGANGRSGVEIVRQLQARGVTVIGAVRSLERARNVLGEQIQLVQLDVTDIAQIRAASAGVDAVVSAIGSNAGKNKRGPETIDYQGIANLATVAAERNWKKLVVLSSMGVTREDHFLNRIANNVLIWKMKGEEAVRATAVDYTIVRPGGLTDGEGGHFINVIDGDRKQDEGMIDRADVARVAVEALFDPAASRKTFAITANKKQPAQGSLTDAFRSIPGG